jgi:inorganic pyrophosphatase/exopolyphosphatase
MGNEAGDADSLVSPLCFAYFNYLKEGASPETEAYAHIPLLSVTRGELELRPETKQLMTLAGLAGLIGGDESSMRNSRTSSSPLLYYDDDDVTADSESGESASRLLNTLTAGASARLTLLDHNSLAPKLLLDSSSGEEAGLLESKVFEIVDHHQDAGKYASSVQHRRVVAFDEVGKVATCGSACTLVAEAFMKKEEEEDAAAKEGTVEKPLERGLATLLAGVVLIDTLNMNEEAKKGTPRDQAALEYLLPRALPPPPPPAGSAAPSSSSSTSLEAFRSSLYSQLIAAKLDPKWWAALGASKCLAYDYKQGKAAATTANPPRVLAGSGGGGNGGAATAAGVSEGVGEGGVTFGMSSVLVSIGDLVRKPGFTQAAATFIQARKLSCLVVMAMVNEDDDDDGDKAEGEDNGQGGGQQRSFKREFLVVAASQEILASVQRALFDGSESMAATLQLTPLDGVASTGEGASDTCPLPTSTSSVASSSLESPVVFAGYSQGQLGKSRKQAMPLLRTALAGLEIP